MTAFVSFRLLFADDVATISMREFPPTSVILVPILGEVNVLFVSVSVVVLATNVSVVAGRVIVTSAVEAGPIRVALFVPLFVPSKNSILPAVVAVGLNIGFVNVLFVSV